jgi:hypothetical protein
VSPAAPLGRPDVAGLAPSDSPSPLKYCADRAFTALLELRAIVASDGYAMTALTLGAYRTDLLATFDSYIQDCTP